MYDLISFAVADRIATHANGSPLVAVQLVAHLVDRGALQGDPGGMWLAPGDVLPASLATLWNEALHRLSEVDGAREALRVAAVLGRTFSHSEWRDACARLGLAVTPSLLGAVVNRGLVLPERVGGRYAFAHGMLRERIENLLKTLTYREREIIRLRYGLGDGYTYTLEEVGQQFSVTRERIRQIEAKALRKLKHPSRSRKLRSFLDN